MTSHILQPWEIMIALVMGGAVQYNDKRTLFQRRITVRKKKKRDGVCVLYLAVAAKNNGSRLNSKRIWNVKSH